MKYVLKGDPAKLCSARYKAKKVYDVHKHLRIHAEIDLRHQHHDRPLYQKPVHLDIHFYLHSVQYTKRSPYYSACAPSLAKLIKFIEDIFEDVVIKDSSIIVSLNTYKKFDENPRIEISIREL